MLDSVRRLVAIPHVPAKALLSTGVLLSFVWLLTQDLIHPLVVYLLELYLTL